MPKSSVIAAIFMAAFSVLGPHQAIAQSFPVKPIRIVTAPPGGGADLVSRLIASAISGGLGQQVIVDNRAGGVIGGEIVSKAQPDGYTVLITGSLWITPVFQTDVPWDPIRDFASISLPSRTPNVLVVHPSLPVRSVGELLAVAKTRPGQLNYGSGVAGAATSSAGDLFRVMAAINIVGVPYKGAGPAMSDLIGGQLQLMFAPVGSVGAYVKAGRLRALAVTTADPSVLAPGLPTVAASGVPGYESAIMYGVFAPAKTPVAIVNRLNQEIVQSLKREDVREKFFGAGMEIVGSSPDEAVTWMKAEMERLIKVMKNSGSDIRR